MFYACIPAYLSIMLTVFYLIARNRNDLKRTAIIQPVLTTLVIVVAAMGFLSPAGEWEYTVWIMVGLSLCLIGDIFNIDMTNNKILYAAIAVFVLAYLEYAAALTRFNTFQPEDWLVGLVFLIIYLLLMRLYWKGLGKFKIPILIYGLVMPFMVTRAISTLFGNTFSLTSAIMVSLGTILLFLGDIEFGVHRFHQPVKFFYAPIFYTSGQLLIALSCSYINL
jgi:uncharacterized membrane protein YhhN